MRALPALVVVLVAAVVGLFVVAVLQSADGTVEATPVGTTTVAAATEPTSAPPPNEEILEHALAVVAAPDTANVIALADAMGASGDRAWVPYLIDVLRFYGIGETVGPIATNLALLTGEPIPDDPRLWYSAFGQWMHREEPVPYGEDDYIAWKSLLYSQADPAFAPLITQVDDPILASQLQWGGVRRGGIPELDEPPRLTVEEAEWMIPDELTFGAEINGEVRSYPHRILDHHEMANDILGGEPVALANCTLCRTGVLFSRRVGDDILYFQSSGLLWNSNKVMVDTATDSLWNQITGEAIAGPLTGTVLDRFPITVTTFGEWVAEHPDTEVLDIPGRTGPTTVGGFEVTGSPYSYEPGAAYADYYASPYVWWPADAVPAVFAEKDLVATLDLDGERLAVGVDALDAAGSQAFTVAGRTVVAVSTDGGARFYGGAPVADPLEVAVEEAGEQTLLLADGTVLDRLQSGHSFWFAWYANYPDTEWWPG